VQLQEDADRAAQQSKPGGSAPRRTHTQIERGQFRATAMAVACLELEEAGRNNTLDGCRQSISKN